MSIRMRVWHGVVSALLVAAACVAYMVAGATVTTGAGHVPSRFKTETIDTGNVAQFVIATGTLNPVGVASVGTQMSGTVLRLHADYNQHVKAGAVLLELDPAIYAAQL